MKTLLTAALVMTALSATAGAQSSDPRLSCWVFNLDSRHGSGATPAIDARINTILADTQQIRYTATDVYLNGAGIPSYTVGPWPGNPGQIGNSNWQLRIPRNPQPATVHNDTGLGSIGVLINGVTIFNAKDAMSYNNQNVWHQNAMVFEASSFDAALGHPAGATYHHHQRPAALLTQLGDRSDVHSPLIGYAFDGFPIYGPYAYTNTNGTGAITRMRSSYRLRNITVRTTYSDGTVVTAGPTVASVALGSYVEDYEYVAGLGDLDQYNGRFCVTPEFPAGTYCYFSTINANGTSAYPYLVGPKYYGTNISEMGVSVPGNAVSQSFSSSFPCTTIWTQPAPASGCRGSTQVLSNKVRFGKGATYQWKLNGQPIANGPHFAGVTTESLTISSLSETESGEYTCAISTPCGTLTTTPAAVTLCLSDMNCDNVSDLSDFFEFLNDFDQTLPGADINADNSIDLGDFFAFLNAFDTGC